jgi:hypothetical protein
MNVSREGENVKWNQQQKYSTAQSIAAPSNNPFLK